MQCEMCGKQTEDLVVAQVEGSKLNVCSDCESFGEVLHDEGKESKPTATRSSSGGTTTSPGSSGGSASSGGGSSGRRRDPFEQIGTLAEDYDSRVRNARETSELTQEELADRLNEKQSLIRKIESGDMRPDEEVRSKLESELGVSLTEDVEEQEWESESAEGGYTLGDIIERKD